MTLLPLMDLRKSAGVLEPVPAAGAPGAGAGASLIWAAASKKKTDLGWRKCDAPDLDKKNKTSVAHQYKKNILLSPSPPSHAATSRAR